VDEEPLRLRRAALRAARRPFLDPAIAQAIGAFFVFCALAGVVT
jgi:hypothetical protein